MMQWRRTVSGPPEKRSVAIRPESVQGMLQSARWIYYETYDIHELPPLNP